MHGVHSNNGSQQCWTQINAITSFIDGSHIYGSSKARVSALKDEGTPYLLKVKLINNTEFPPERTGPDVDSCIKRNGSDDICFDTGDGRGNENPSQAVLYTIFLREHNRIARQIKSLKPNATDEGIFETARKIIGALLQKITYVDYFGALLGRDINTHYLFAHKGRTKFNPSVDPSAIISFATAAFRLRYTQIIDTVPVGDTLKVPLSEVYNRPAFAIDNLEDLVHGMTSGSSRLQGNQIRTNALDRNFVQGVTNKYYEPLERPGYGLDLVALTIQRGRDHGLPSYTKFREFCNLRPLTGFDDTDALGPFASNFAQVYNSVDDIDLFPALMHEKLVTGLGGPTLNCLLVIGFYRLKFGDRFFFTHDQEQFGFNNAQLASIRSTTLARIFCHNTNIDSLPSAVFRLPSSKNRFVSCETLRTGGLDLELFADLSTQV
ncbi:peroxidase [Plakobranchus ocellatus]|uniref:Peroxidase n=1 Tax=Plakobranchus ocellatus TaxID=259542 RepID=A0AAV4DG20_9GAST|nr:peroxidase [Plakobranchus ocellatus]